MSITAPPVHAVLLTAYELRALANTAALVEGILDRDPPLALPEGHAIRPLQSAQLKIEMALVLAQEDR